MIWPFTKSRAETPKPTAPSQTPEAKQQAADIAVARQKMQLEKQAAEHQLEKLRMQEEIDDIKEERRLKQLERQARIQELLGGEKGGMKFEDQLALNLFNKFSTPGQTAARSVGGDLYSIKSGVQIIQPAQQVAQAPPAQTLGAATGHAFRHYTDIEIDGLYAQIPAPILAQAKALDDQTLGDQIAARVPDMDDESIERMIAKVRSA